MALSALDHVNIHTARPDETIAFYTEVLGLENRPDLRPDFGRPGAWLFLGDQPVVHLNFVSEDLGETNGAFNHLAFAGDDFHGLKAILDERGLRYEASDRPDIGLQQIFVQDPNGVTVEINVRSKNG